MRISYTTPNRDHVPFPGIPHVACSPWLPEAAHRCWGQDRNFITLYLMWSPDLCSWNFVLISRPTFSLFIHVCIFFFSAPIFTPSPTPSFPFSIFFQKSAQLWACNEANLPWHTVQVLKTYTMTPLSPLRNYIPHFVLFFNRNQITFNFIL